MARLGAARSSGLGGSRPCQLVPRRLKAKGGRRHLEVAIALYHLDHHEATNEYLRIVEITSSSSRRGPLEREDPRAGLYGAAQYPRALRIAVAQAMGLGMRQFFALCPTEANWVDREGSGGVSDCCRCA